MRHAKHLVRTVEQARMTSAASFVTDAVGASRQEGLPRRWDG
jgi:hypothetical protein